MAMLSFFFCFFLGYFHFLELSAAIVEAILAHPNHIELPASVIHFEATQISGSLGVATSPF